MTRSKCAPRTYVRLRKLLLVSAACTQFLVPNYSTVESSRVGGLNCIADNCRRISVEHLETEQV